MCETLFTKGIRFYACFFVSFFFTQGAQGLVIQLGPTKLCMMQPGKRTCRSVPGRCKRSWIDQHRDKAEQLEPTTSLRGCLQVCVCVQPCDPRENFFPRFYVHMFTSRGLAAYSVMPANEASGIGGWSYGRIALYLQEVDRTLIHQKKSGPFLFPETSFQKSNMSE